MIHIKNLSKEFGDHVVLKHIDIDLPRYGLVGIVGPSGCGKTTLMNCISGLLSFSGEIIIDNNHMSSMSEKEKGYFRLNNIGFVFQDFKLFENETVEQNILLPLNIVNNSSSYRKQRKCNDLISIVGLNKSKEQKINTLSGGEKQRVAIARALANEPCIILADEPTGSLDSVNSESIMSILQSISSKVLVVIVSHDIELLEKYAERLIHIEDGSIKRVTFLNRQKHDIYFPVCKNQSFKRKPSLPFSFLFHHTFQTIKTKKFRTLLCNTMTSFGLIGIGIAISISNSISNNIKNSYSSLIDDSNIMIFNKEKHDFSKPICSGSYYEAFSLMKEYHSFINDIGITYYNDFESFFPDHDEFVLNVPGKRKIVDGIFTRHINEFRWLDECEEIIYPSYLNELRDDEIILSLTISMVEDICLFLQIERTVSSLSTYISNNLVSFYFDFENKSWNYQDQQIFTLKGFTLENKAGIYHSNHLWNELVFESLMRFPTTDIINQDPYYPWTLKKIYYFNTNELRDEFIEKSSLNPILDSHVLEIADTTYYPWLYKDIDICDRRRVLFLYKTTPTIPRRYDKLFLDSCPYVSNVQYCSYGSYVSFPNSFLYGFAQPIFFSFNENSLLETIDSISYVKEEEGQTINLPYDVTCGHYSKNALGGVVFRSIPEKLHKGRKPDNLDEIVISSKMASDINKSQTVLNKDLLVAYTISEINSKGKIIRDYVYRTLKVVGIVESTKNAIYHNPFWTISFFQCRLGISAFELGITTMAFNIDKESNSDKAIAKLSKAFPSFEIINPMDEINQSIEQICFYLQMALIAFSSIALIISFILLSFCNHLHVFENRKDIGLSRCLGVDKKEAKKFLFFHAFINGGLSFLLSAIELLVINFVISYELSAFLSASFSFSFNPIAMLYMFVVLVVISLLSCFLIGSSLERLSPLEALKR